MNMESFLFFLSLFSFDCAGSLLLCPGFSLVAVSGGYSLAVVHGSLIAVASPVAEHRHQGSWASMSCLQAPGHRLNSCSAWV